MEVEGHPKVDFPALGVCQEDSDVSWEGELGPERRKGSGTAQAPTTGSNLRETAQPALKGQSAQTGTFYHREFHFQPVS